MASTCKVFGYRDTRSHRRSCTSETSLYQINWSLRGWIISLTFGFTAPLMSSWQALSGPSVLDTNFASSAFLNLRKEVKLSTKLSYWSVANKRVAHHVPRIRLMLCLCVALGFQHIQQAKMPMFLWFGHKYSCCAILVFTHHRQFCWFCSEPAIQALPMSAVHYLAYQLRWFVAW